MKRKAEKKIHGSHLALSVDGGQHSDGEGNEGDGLATQ
jgi:hypothetical protein